MKGAAYADDITVKVSSRNCFPLVGDLVLHDARLVAIDYGKENLIQGGKGHGVILRPWRVAERGSAGRVRTPVPTQAWHQQSISQISRAPSSDNIVRFVGGHHAARDRNSLKAAFAAN